MNKEQNDPIAFAAHHIQQGHLVVFPTETVYGLAADAANPQAVKRIYTVKRRPSGNPLIVHIALPEQVAQVAHPPNKIEQQLMQAFWPGPLTIILQRHPHFPDAVCAGHSTIAVRWPSSPLFQQLILKANTPIAAPSANPSGKPSPTCFDDLHPDVISQTAYALDGGSCEHGLESTVVRVLDDQVTILRPGPITAETIAAQLNVPVNGKSNRTTHVDAAVLSPGTQFKHYAPSTPLQLVLRHNLSKVIKNYSTQYPSVALLATHEQQQHIQSCPPNVTIIDLGSEHNMVDVAANIFKALHTLDRIHVDVGIIHDFDEKGIGIAMMDRLRKASLHKKTNSQ